MHILICKVERSLSVLRCKTAVSIHHWVHNVERFVPVNFLKINKVKVLISMFLFLLDQNHNKAKQSVLLKTRIQKIKAHSEFRD